MEETNRAVSYFWVNGRYDGSNRLLMAPKAAHHCRPYWGPFSSFSSVSLSLLSGWSMGTRSFFLLLSSVEYFFSLCRRSCAIRVAWRRDVGPFVRRLPSRLPSFSLLSLSLSLSYCHQVNRWCVRRPAGRPVPVAGAFDWQRRSRFFLSLGISTDFPRFPCGPGPRPCPSSHRLRHQTPAKNVSTVEKFCVTGPFTGVVLGCTGFSWVALDSEWRIARWTTECPTFVCVCECVDNQTRWTRGGSERPGAGASAPRSAGRRRPRPGRSLPDRRGPPFW